MDAQKYPAPVLYFFDGASRIPEAYEPRFGIGLKKQWPGLSALFSGRNGYFRGMGKRGPNGRTGLMATPFAYDKDPDKALVFDPAKQVFAEIEAGVWVIVSKDVTPLDFMRSETVWPKPPFSTLKFTPDWEIARNPDNPLAMNWVLPIALVDSPRCTVPMKDSLVRGEWRSVPAQPFAALAEIAETFYRAEKGEIPQPDRDWKRQATCDVIAVNYAVTPAELAVMGILCDAVYNAVADIVTDGDARRAEAEAQKKTLTQSGGQSTDSGSPDA